MISVCLFEEFGMASSCTSVSRSLTPLRCRPAREAPLEGKQGQGPHGAPKPKPPTSQSTTSHISPPLTHTLWDKRSFQDPCQTKTAVANEVRKLAKLAGNPSELVNQGGRKPPLVMVRPSDALLKLLHELLQCWPVGAVRKKMVVCFLMFSKLSPQLTALVCPSNFSSQFHPVSPANKTRNRKNLASPTPLVALTHPPFPSTEGSESGEMELVLGGMQIKKETNPLSYVFQK